MIDQKATEWVLVGLSLPDAVLDAVLLASPTHLLACYTQLVSMRREIVAVEVRPHAERWPLSDNRLDSLFAEALQSWLGPSLDSLGESLPPQPPPISAKFLRHLPLGLALAERAKGLGVATTQEPLAVHLMSTADESQLSDADMRLLPYLRDALMYATAVRVGDRSPAKVIAKYHGITTASAQGRIAKSRDRGLLDTVGRGQVGGSLTPKGEALFQRLQDAGVIRVIGKA